MTDPIEVFCSYSHKDAKLRDQLDTALANLKRQGVITSWHDRQIEAGTEWETEIAAHLNAARIILLLISPDFMDSDYCYSIEMKRAIERHDAGEAKVVPIILRDTDWQGAPFSKLQALPTDAKPVVRWRSRDAAFADISKGIRRVLERYAQPQPQATRTTAEPRDQTSIDARIKLHQLYQEAQAAMTEGNWRRGEDLIRRILRQDEHFADARSALGIAAADTVRAQFYGQGLNQYGFDNQPQHDLVDMAIRWLEEARQWGEDSDGRVSAALAVTYGLAQRYEDMLAAIDAALSRDPARWGGLASAESLICLLRACTAEGDEETVKRARRLGTRLRLQIPASAYDLEASAAQYSADAVARGRGQAWVAFARRSFWKKKDASERPAPLALLLIFVGQQRGGTETMGRYFTRPGVYLPLHGKDVPGSNTWLPAIQLFSAFDECFILLRQISEIQPVPV